MDVLSVLAKDPGEVFSKEEIIQSVWPDTFVSEDALFRCIRELRRIFDDDARNPTYIQTIPKKGYRLIAEVSNGEKPLEKDASQAEVDPSEKDRKEGRRRGFRLIHALVLVAIVASALVYLNLVRQEAKTDPISSVAVLPFISLSDGPEMEYLGVGIADSIAFRLSQLKRIRVISNVSALRYMGKDIDPKNVSRELGVRALLLGKLARSKNGISVSAELVDGQNNRLLWGHNYKTSVSNLLTLQEEIAREISLMLKLKISGEEEQRLSRYYTDNSEAYQLYLKGRYHWNKASREGIKKSIDYFEKAINLHPDYALAYSGLADSYALLGFYNIVPPEKAFPLAKSAALKALDLDEGLAEAHTSLAAVREVYEWDWDSAGRSYRRAFELNPSYATARHWYALCLAEMGRSEEALAQIKIAHSLAPLSLSVNNSMGQVYYLAMEPEKAISQFRKTLELESDFSPALNGLGLSLLRLGHYQEAIASIKKAHEASPNPSYLSSLAYAYAVAGQTEQARKLLGELLQLSDSHYVSAYDVGIVYIGLNEREAAFKWLEKAYQERAHGLATVAVDPRVARLHDDRRFASIIKRIGLGSYTAVKANLGPLFFFQNSWMVPAEDSSPSQGLRPSF